MRTLAIAVMVAGMAAQAAWAQEVAVDDGQGQQGVSVKPRKLLGASGGAERKGPVVFVGRLSSVDATGQVVVVSGSEADPHDVSKSVGATEDRSFKVNALCRIKTEEKNRASIKDLSAGEEVVIRFSKDIRGAYKAETLEPLGPIQHRQAEEKKKKGEDNKRKH